MAGGLSTCLGRKIEIRTDRKAPESLDCLCLALFVRSDAFLPPGFAARMFVYKLLELGTLPLTGAFSSLQVLSSSTPAWPCWVSSSFTAACQRPKPGAWRRSKRSSRTSFAPAAPQIQTKGARWNTSASRAQTTTCQTTTHPMWTRDGVCWCRFVLG